MTKAEKNKLYAMVGITMLVNSVLFLGVSANYSSNQANYDAIQEFVNRGSRYTACDGAVHEYVHHSIPLPEDCK